MIELASLCLLLTSSWVFTSLLDVKGRVINLISLWLLALAQIVLAGYITSLVDHFGNLQYWLLPQSAFLMLTMIAKRMCVRGGLRRLASEFLTPPQSLRPWQLVKSLPPWQATTVMLLFATVIVLGIANCCVLILGTPHQWDSLTYHIARVAYFLQHGNIHPFPANYWAQTVHPKVSAILNAYLFMASSRNEHMFQLHCSPIGFQKKCWTEAFSPATR